MLVLTRKRGQSVILTLPDTQKIEVFFLGFELGQAKIGFEAPNSVNIARKEIMNRPENYGNK